MDEEVLNTSVRKFLKKVGITAQREIEKAVREGISSGRLKGTEALHAEAFITIAGVDLRLTSKATLNWRSGGWLSEFSTGLRKPASQGDSLF